MLSNQHFYHKLLRKYVSSFGNIFNRIQLLRYDENGIEIERIMVPILYATKEKYTTRLNTDPTLNKETAITLPRMSFEITGINHNPTRKQTNTIRINSPRSSTGSNSQYMFAPYDINFELNIYARNVDDGNQIIEQIIPYFNPDLTYTYNLIPSMNISKDIPLTLDSVISNIEYEGNFDSVRYVYWTLSFTMGADFWGPISNPKIIRKVITNIFNDPSLQAGYLVRINTSNGNNGTFKLEDIVYQGDSYQTATAYGKVNGWSANTGKLIIGAAQGQFKVNSTIRTLSTNAVYNIQSFDASPLKLATITVDPDPITANANSDFGYTTTITEYPETVT